MSEFAPKPTLATLPAELIDLMAPVSSNFTLPLLPGPLHGSVRLLQSLSCTCRRLRQLILPRLWSALFIFKVKQLGTLHELFKSSPHLALHVKIFKFKWIIDGDVRPCRTWDPSEGSMLDLAFRDRLHHWDTLRKASGASIKLHSKAEKTAEVYFERQGKRFRAPGRCHELKGLYDSAGKPVFYDCCAPRVRGDGPDGKGEDKLIKTPDQLLRCLEEVVAQLGSLHKFSWSTRVMPMPTGVFNALVSSTTLEELHLYLPLCREEVQDLPYWELSPKLKTLRIRLEHELEQKAPDLNEEQSEESLVSVDVAASLPLPDSAARLAYHVGIVSRTVIAAARSGNLRCLDIRRAAQQPFAVRTLLPSWLQIESWIVEGKVSDTTQVPTPPWQQAAASLRPLLAHASLWLGTTSITGERHDRLLSASEVQSLAVYFASEEFGQSARQQLQHVQRYLPWLAEDAELARKVAEAWNTLVRTGKADVVRCKCEMCTRLGAGADKA